MSDGHVPATVVVNIVLYAFIANILVMAIGFATVAGVASLLGLGELAAVFTPAAGILGLGATLLSVLRSALVDLLSELVAG